MGCRNDHRHRQLPLILLFILATFSFPFSTSAQRFIGNGSTPTPPGFNVSKSNGTVSLKASLSTLWSAADAKANVFNVTDGWSLVLVLVLRNTGPSFACGLLCLRSSNTVPCSSVRFGIFLVVVDGNGSVRTNLGTPEVVWSVNRNSRIGGNAVLRFTADGDLRLEDDQGAVVWSTGTSAAGMSLNIDGNLRLYRKSGRTVWQSFDYPTDTALQGQALTGKKLVANTSAGNSSEGRFFVSVLSTVCYAYVRVDPSSQWQIYYSLPPQYRIADGILLSLPERYPNLERAQTFLRLDADGHLRNYEWLSEEEKWKDNGSFMDDDYRGTCAYPTVCGPFGNCTEGQQCSCPRTSDKNSSYFEPIMYETPKEGCKLKVNLSCLPEHLSLHRLLDFGNTAFYGYAGPGDIIGTDINTCKEACMRNCSCRGAFFKYDQSKNSKGDCYLPSTILSLTANNRAASGYSSSAFFKIQISEDQVVTTGASSLSWRWKMKLSLGLLCALVVGGACAVVILTRKLKKHRQPEEAGEQEIEGYDFSQLPGMPTRFAYEELRSATDGFSTKLGEGGFGAVFRGTLREGTEIAVKLLGYRGQGMKEFLAEVETIGSIHHVNLVRLVGYCAERFHRLLVYEFLSNGSLDKWIFHEPPLLDWLTKHRLILDVARGLSYLHEDCRQRILHLDIKPQNILLDDKFNGKVSDFGLSKLIERDQSQVVTTLRGTPGYIAPEWLNSTITEKVDVYSFGVVVLETVTGKRVLDNSRPQGSINLLSLLKKAADENRLHDLVGAECEGEEAMALVRVAMWCLQGDYNRRPSMSTVVKVLEGLMNVEADLDPNFWVSSTVSLPIGVPSSSSCSTPLLPSLVSGPR